MTTVILGDLVNPRAPAYNEMLVRRGRIVRSSAHDWKSCIPQGIEGSNPSLSATSPTGRLAPEAACCFVVRLASAEWQAVGRRIGLE
jgi:hypothetical protein